MMTPFAFSTNFPTLPKALEDFLIRTYDLPLNSKGNRTHPFYKSLSALRRRADIRTGTSSERPMRPADWREDAIRWIRSRAANLPPQPTDRWEVSRPTAQACETAIRVIKLLGPSAQVPSALVVTLSEGIELAWRHGNKLLSIEVMADGTLESLKSVGGQPIEEEKLNETEKRMDKLVAWVGAT
jgi:hypothetical protein